MARAQLQEELFNDTWFMSKEHAHAYLPVIAAVIKGESFEQIQLAQTPSEKRYKTYRAHYLATDGTAYLDYEQRPSGAYKMVIPVIGMITKFGYDLYLGTKDMIDYIDFANSQTDINEIVFKIQSGGGMMMGTFELVEAIQNSTIRTTAVVDGLAASAAYWIASACDSILLNNKLAVVGSIGAMTSIVDFTAYYEKMGIKVQDVYAPQSTKKSKAYRAFQKDGDTSLIEADLKDACDFLITSVKINRKAVKEECYEGDTYTGDAALSVGLADAVLDYSKKSTKNKSTQNKMKVTALLATLLGSGKDGDGNITLTAQQATEMSSGLARANTTIEQASALFGAKAKEDSFDLFASVRELQDEKNALTKSAADKDAEIADLKAQVELLGKSPGDTTSTHKKDGDGNDEPELTASEKRMAEKRDFISAKRKARDEA